MTVTNLFCKLHMCAMINYHGMSLHTLCIPFLKPTTYFMIPFLKPQTNLDYSSACTKDLCVLKSVIYQGIHITYVFRYFALAIIEGVSGKRGHVPFQIFQFLKIGIACFSHMNNVVTK